MRNYKDEYKKHHSSTKAKKDRAARNKARNAAKKRSANVGGKDVDHKKPLRSGGSRKVSNTRVRARSANRSANGHKPGERQKKHK